MSHLPLVRATTSPIPMGHGLVGGIARPSMMRRWGWRTGKAVCGHGSDGGSSYETKGVVMERESWARDVD